MSQTEYIAALTLDEGSIIKRAPEIEQERETAIRDLLVENMFDPVEMNKGPYKLHLSVLDNRLQFEMTDAKQTVHNETLTLMPFRRIIKDYFMICESYFEAVKTNNAYKVEAVDMGRRGIHNEGSTMLRELLHDKIRIDFDTARRLFTIASGLL